MFTCASPRTGERLVAGPGIALHPCPHQRDLPHPERPWRSPPSPSSSWSGVSASTAAPEVRAGARSPTGRRGLLRRLGLVLNDHVHVHIHGSERAQHAAGDPRAVGDAGEGDARLVDRVRHGCDQGSFHGGLLVDDEGTWSCVEAGSAVDGDAVVARILDACAAGARRHPTPPSRALPRRRPPQACGRRPRFAGSALKIARNVSVELADVGVQGGGERDGGGVKAVRCRAWSRQPTWTRPRSRPPARSCLRPEQCWSSLPHGRRGCAPSCGDVSVTIPACADHVGDRLVAEVVDHHRRREHTRSSLRGRRLPIARGCRGSETSSAIATSSSVVFPRAESTATTRLPSSAACTMCRAARGSAGVGDRSAAELITTVCAIGDAG